MPHKKDSFWIVRMETNHRGYLKMSTRNETFDSEKRAWRYVDKMMKMYPDCRLYVGRMENVNNFQMQLDFKSAEEHLDF